MSKAVFSRGSLGAGVGWFSPSKDLAANVPGQGLLVCAVSRDTTCCSRPRKKLAFAETVLPDERPPSQRQPILLEAQRFVSHGGQTGGNWLGSNASKLRQHIWGCWPLSRRGGLD